MTVLSKTLLAVAITGLVAGTIIDAGSFAIASGWTAVLPAGAIAFGMFLVVLALEREVAKFDKEEAEKLQRLAAIEASLDPTHRQS